MKPSIDLTRRESLKTIGLAAATLLVGCGSDDATSGSSSSSALSSEATSSSSTSSLFSSRSSAGSSVASSSSARSASSTASSESSALSSEAVSSAEAVSSETAVSSAGESSVAASSADADVAWAAGGTDLITVDFPDDTLFDNAGTCTLSLTERTTEGPCYLGVEERQDISDGKTGLPMQLCLQLVDASCSPLQGYLIEVWHCDRAGIYSGDTSQSDDASTFAGNFCTGGDSAATSNIWFRGEQTTDANGRVNFASCFPGWYSGRTIHIHYRVRLTNGGSDYIVSQFCFTDTFCEEICTNHSLYASRGSQDTPLSGGRDTVFPSSGYDEYIMNFSQNSDGSLLAYKRIMISA